MSVELRSSRLAAWCLLLWSGLSVTMVTFIDASYCTDEQTDSCKRAVRENGLEELPGGGECQAKQYVQYTHLCTVRIANYVPSVVDYCCCGLAQKIMCCRYHYDWNYFRCAEADDTIETLYESALPLELLLTAVLAPTVLVLCCVFCCVRRFCCADDDEENVCCACSRCSEKDDHNITGGGKVSVDDLNPQDEAQVPLNYQSSKTHLCSASSGEGTPSRAAVCGGPELRCTGEAAHQAIPSAPPQHDVFGVPCSAFSCSSSSGGPPGKAPVSKGTYQGPSHTHHMPSTSVPRPLSSDVQSPHYRSSELDANPVLGDNNTAASPSSAALVTPREPPPTYEESQHYFTVPDNTIAQTP